LRRAILLSLALTACSPPKTPPPTSASAGGPPVSSYTPVQPIAPGAPGGLPDDRTPISEAPYNAAGAQGAANVVQTYFALIGEKKYALAYALWDPGAAARPAVVADFARNLASYLEYRAQVGAPGSVQGAAGSSFVNVPVQVYGRRAGGSEFHSLGRVTLRRVNDVPGSTLQQRAWRIQAIELP
jgi:hypothetical protein